MSKGNGCVNEQQHCRGIKRVLVGMQQQDAPVPGGLAGGERNSTIECGVDDNAVLGGSDGGEKGLVPMSKRQMKKLKKKAW